MAFTASGTSQPSGQSRCSRKVLRTEGFPVVNFGGPTFASDRESLLGQMGRQIGTIVERGDIAVSEGEFEATAVLAIAVARFRLYRGDGRAGQEAEQVHEMAGLADDPSPTLLRIERPVTGR